MSEARSCPCAEGRKATWRIGGLWGLLVRIHSGGSSSSNSGSGSGSGKVVIVR